MLIDLHFHSYYSSDADFSPTELVGIAQKQGLKIISLTDHDSVAGVGEFLQAGKAAGLEPVPGVEITGRYQGEWYHILAYYLDWQNKELAEFMAIANTAQTQLIKDVVAVLAERGYSLSYDDVLKYKNELAVAGYVTIAKAIYKGKPDYEEQYFDFMNDVLKPLTPADYNDSLPPVEDVIALILKLGGVPVLAHPGLQLDSAADRSLEVVKTFKEMGLEGIEAVSTYHDARAVDVFLQMGLDLDLLITMGSDFHGELKPTIDMGGAPKVDFPVVDTLLKQGFFRGL